MTEELKETEKKECKCFCHSEWFRNFLTIAIGSFVGVYFALSLFAALHRPPMMPPCAKMRGCPVKMMHHHHFNKAPRMDRPDFQVPVRTEGPAPFEGQIPQQPRR